MHAVGPCPGLKPRADTAKPTEGARDAVSGGWPDHHGPDVAIVAPSVGLPTIQPGGLSPGHGPGCRILRTTHLAFTPRRAAAAARYHSGGSGCRTPKSAITNELRSITPLRGDNTTGAGPATRDGITRDRR